MNIRFCTAMDVESPRHSMSPEDRTLALEVLSLAFERLDSSVGSDTSSQSQESILAAVQAAAGALPRGGGRVSEDYARYAAEAAVWYLDRAVRRVADADRDGLTAAQRAANLAWFGSFAGPAEIERLFALAAALNAEDA